MRKPPATRPPEPRTPTGTVALLALVGLALAGVGLAIGVKMGTPDAPAPRSVTIVRPTPNVLVAVRDLARIETATFHMERVMDLTDRQSRLFGLVQAEDALLLVAAGDIVAGIDLEEMRAQDVTVSPDRERVRLVLPPAKVLSSRLDPERTYVHTRRTDALAKRREDLESRARKEAENALVAAAIEAGLLRRAQEQAGRVVERLVKGLGFTTVELVVRTPLPGAGSAEGVHSPP